MADAIDRYATTFRARAAARRLAATRRAVDLRDGACRAARRLGEELGARRVWLFGSLAWGTPHEASDVDLLVEGLPADAWSSALRLAELELQAPVDVVRVEDAAPGLVDRVRAHGVLLLDA
jgi:predicted nucleotidyltransferase